MSFSDENLRVRLTGVNAAVSRELWRTGSPAGAPEIWLDQASALGWEVEEEEVVEASFKHKGRTIEKKSTQLLALDTASGQLVLVIFSEHNPDLTRLTKEAYRLLTSGGPAVRFAAFAAGPAEGKLIRDPLTPSLRKLGGLFQELPDSEWWRQVGPAEEGVEIFFHFCNADRGWAGAKRFSPPLDRAGFIEYSEGFFQLDYELEDGLVKVLDPERHLAEGWLFLGKE